MSAEVAWLARDTSTGAVSNRRHVSDDVGQKVKRVQAGICWQAAQQAA